MRHRFLTAETGWIAISSCPFRHVSTLQSCRCGLPLLCTIGYTSRRISEMSAPDYQAVPHFADDGQPMFQSPEMISRPWRSSSGGNQDGIEMQQTRPYLSHQTSQISFAADGLMQTQKPSMTERGAFEVLSKASIANCVKHPSNALSFSTNARRWIAR